MIGLVVAALVLLVGVATVWWSLPSRHCKPYLMPAAQHEIERVTARLRAEASQHATLRRSIAVGMRAPTDASWIVMEDGRRRSRPRVEPVLPNLAPIMRAVQDAGLRLFDPAKTPGLRPDDIAWVRRMEAVGRDDDIAIDGPHRRQPGLVVATVGDLERVPSPHVGQMVYCVDTQTTYVHDPCGVRPWEVAPEEWQP